MATPDAAALRALVKTLMAAGQTKAEATAHAQKILGEQDRVIVGKDGKERPAPVGPML